MPLPEVRLTMILVSRRAPVAVAMLSDANGRTRAATRDPEGGDGARRCASRPRFAWYATTGRPCT